MSHLRDNSASWEYQRYADRERGACVLKERPDAGHGEGERRHEPGRERHEPARVGGERPRHHAGRWTPVANGFTMGQDGMEAQFGSPSLRKPPRVCRDYV
jgi:hypothetical protein